MHLSLSVLGANVNRATANNDHTVVSLACAGGHLAVVELLLAHGADPTHRLKVMHPVWINTSCFNNDYAHLRVFNDNADREKHAMFCLCRMAQPC